MDNVLLVSFYNQKSLGLRYLENVLEHHGYHVKTLFFKKFNSIRPKEVTDRELELLRKLIAELNPLFVGLSAMVSHYLEVVDKVSDFIRENFSTPVVWGGVYATMFPERCAARCDFVVRGEGEEAIVELANAIKDGKGNFADIKNLTYHENGQVVQNEMRKLITELDKYGVPSIGGDKCMIEDDTIIVGDPQLTALSYEMAASRGCPFACTYCCSINISRITAKGGKYVRFREVDDVMTELINAKAKVKNLKVVHFWDEIFCDDEEWVDRFIARYKKEIGLPFEIWGHPLKCGDDLIRKLRQAGLYKVVMGIQSGSPYIRKEIFRRPESQEAIIEASRVLSRNKVPQVIYDFMLRHPFESRETIQETFRLTTELAGPFQLQLHGLSFLPGSDIIQIALKKNVISQEELDRQMNASLQEQYDSHWEFENADEVINFWYNLTYLSQFKWLKKRAKKLADGEINAAAIRKTEKLCKIGRKLAKFIYLYHKGIIAIKGTLA
ncbi:MAG: B12-binding domain-containing radical SAM protein [Turicibacter sp.]|nr:B12-binding domain-containing radical SAM protein [Turicibacter sp.]